MFSLIEALGVRVVEVDDLRDPACLVRSQGLALIRADLDPGDREAVLSRLIPMVAVLPVRPPRTPA